MADVLAYDRWKTNAHLIEDVARLGYLRRNWLTLDPTYGKGTFWKRWQPYLLFHHDIAQDGVDFRELPYADERFEAVVFDPPYKLNGTPTETVDARYGVNVPANRDSRMRTILDGVVECARVCSGMLLVKCQDQVCAGKVRWQTLDIIGEAEAYGFTLVDRFDMIGGRKQPAGRRQVHARRNASTLLVFER